MYILCKLEKRAETTDTILYFAANNKSILEEILLSLFDEVYEHELNINSTDSDPINEKSILDWCIKQMSNFSIVWVPYIN